MNTEEFHKLLEENTQEENALRSKHQAGLAGIQNDYNATMDEIFREQRKVRTVFQVARDTYETEMRRLEKLRGEAAQTYNRSKAELKNALTLNNNRLQAERHNLFERYCNSGGQFLNDASGLLHPGWIRDKK